MNMKKIWERFIRKLSLLFNFAAKSDYYVENFKCLRLKPKEVLASCVS